VACGLGGSTDAAGGFGGVACDLGGTTGTAGGLGEVAGICGFGGVAGVTISFGGASVEGASGFLTAAASLMGEGVLRDWDAAGEDDCLGGGELSGGGTVTGPNGLLLLGALFVAGVAAAADVSGFFTSTAAAAAAFGLEWLLLLGIEETGLVDPAVNGDLAGGDCVAAGGRGGVGEVGFGLGGMTGPTLAVLGGGGPGLGAGGPTGTLVTGLLLAD